VQEQNRTKQASVVQEQNREGKHVSRGSCTRTKQGNYASGRSKTSTGHAKTKQVNVKAKSKIDINRAKT
jgi:hypothetical protein